MSAQEATEANFTTFDAPCAGTGSGQGTIPFVINTLGAITGFCHDANYVEHGFLRSPDGRITTFEAPGSGSVPGTYQGTVAFDIDLFGAIAGNYEDENYEYHGLLRSPDGTFTSFEAPGACGGGTLAGCLGTGAYDINLFGTIAGQYSDANFVIHGFVRAPDGSIMTFEAPGAGSGSYQGTFVSNFQCLNQLGAITGYYTDANSVNHGFLRRPDGTFTTFEAPGAGTVAGSFEGTQPASINLEGTIAGTYIDANSVYHGFLRSPNGTFTTFEAPGADTNPGDFNGTYPSNINDSGAITGSYQDVSNVFHGFVRAPDGSITTFEAPGSGTGAFQGTVPESSNAEGTVTGYYQDANNVYHGFVRTH